MQREIKLRAWDSSNKIMFYSDEIGDGDLHYNFFFEEGIMKAQSIYSPDIENWLEMQLFDCEVMQYTGFKDKNGICIYEEDILSPLSASVGPMYVRWENGSFVTYTRFGRWGLLSRLSDPDFIKFYPEVIGNIHQNPELLNK